MRPALKENRPQGIGRHAENVRIRTANLELNKRCLAQLEGTPPGSRDIFRRTAPELQAIIRFQEAALAIAKSI